MMNRLAIGLGVLVVLAGVAHALISPSLQKQLSTARADQRLPVQIVLNQQFDNGLLRSLVDGMPRPARRVEVARILQEFSREQQAGLLAYLEGQVAQGAVAKVKSLWIVNAACCEATPAVVRALDQRPEVHYVNYDLVQLADDPVEPRPAGEGGENIAWGVSKINAPAVWQQGYTGQGIVVGLIDDGCEYDHPDLRDHMWTDPNYPYHGWDFVEPDGDPYARGSHGALVAGILAGDGTGGTHTGVAPDAQIMACAIDLWNSEFSYESSCWQAIQFCVSPPLSPLHGADLYTLSSGLWGEWIPQHLALWRDLARNVNAAGLSQIAACGNEGQGDPPYVIRIPARIPPPWWDPQKPRNGSLAGVVAVGGTDSDDNIWDGSSRGPATWWGVPGYDDWLYYPPDHPGLTKPDVSAPCVGITTTADGHYVISGPGTSLAAPHVSGTVCLMLSKNPGLTPEQIDSILETTAVDRGPAGKDNDYGAGRIDALAAVNSVTARPGDPNATYPNWGRKFVREIGTDNYHVVYTYGDTVFYSQSTNGGGRWSYAEPIGLGRYPAIALNGWIGVEGQVPWAAYLTADGSIMRAVRVAPGTWDKAVVFQGSPAISAGAPSLAASPVAGSPQGPEAHVVYPVGFGVPPLDHYVYFNTFSAYGVSPPEIIDAPGLVSCYGASVVVTPGSAIHVCWIRGQSVLYSRRLNSVWSPPWPISTPFPPITQPASNPSIEAYGDSVFCVWHGPNNSGGFPGDVWRSSRCLSDPVCVWATPTNQSQTPAQESDFPVMTTNFATVWHEQVSEDNWDIWGRFLAGMGPQPVFESPLPSRYPHVDGYWVPGVGEFMCNSVFTEQLYLAPPLYEVKFVRTHYIPVLGKGSGPGPHNGYEPGMYYAAELGQPEQSPYCVSRGGYAKLGSWNVDTSGTILKYQLPYLDPRRTYELRAVIYHEGKKSWSADVRCDSGPWVRMHVTPGVPDTVWVQVPKRLYKDDAKIAVELARVTGDFAPLAELSLFQVEDGARGDEGAQGVSTAGPLATRLLNCTPNPFGRATAIHYQVGCAGPVDLTVHDVSGRVVRRLEAGSRLVGTYYARWDGADSRGHTVPAGVYFVRLAAGGRVSTGRLTLVR